MKKKIVPIIFCSLIMLITAASDSLRGVFLPQFGKTFSLSGTGGSMIITMSYIGNLLFLLAGGYISDRVPKKKFLFGVMILWSTALALHAFTENYTVLLICIMFSMGGSTMISTTVNIITPLMFTASALLVNLFNFCQGVGITATQNIFGRINDRIDGWHLANMIFLSICVVCFIFLIFMKIPEPEKDIKETENKKAPRRSVLATYKAILKNKAAVPLIIITGCYFIGEHGLQNWLTSYGSMHLGYTVQESAMFLSYFFGFMTIGRLIFAPVVQKAGIFRSMLIFSTGSALLYFIGIAGGRDMIMMVCVSGLGFSVLYPTLVLLIKEYFDDSLAGSAVGFVLSAATFFDIGFNAVFGGFADTVGFGIAIYILPTATALLAAGLFVLYFKTRRPAKTEE